MSTRINISIDDGGLVDRNAQQQAAARQANQQRASAEKAATEGQRQLEQERIRKGLDPATGERLPSAGSSSRIQRIDQEPAANRQTDVSIGIFYSKFPENSSSDELFFSGDGRQQALLSIPVAEGTEYPILQSDFPDIPTTSPPNSFVISGTLEVITDDFDPESFQIGTRIVTRKSFVKRRETYSYQANSTHIFPLNNNSALIVKSQEYGNASVITKYFIDNKQTETTVATDDGLLFTTFEDVLLEQTFTAELENNWSPKEDWAAVIVGDKVAKVIEVPESLKKAIKTIKFDEDDPIATYTFNSAACLYAATQFIPDGDYSDRCIGYPGEWGYDPYGSVVNPGPRFVLTAVSPLSRPPQIEFAGTSLTNYGTFANTFIYGDATSPIAWLHLESKDLSNAINNATNHDNLYSITTLSENTIGDLIKKNHMVNVTNVSALKAWTGNRFFAEDFRVPEPSDFRWRGRVKTLQVLDFLGDFDRTYYINTWGQAAFCRQQASKYGILA